MDLQKVGSEIFGFGRWYMELPQGSYRPHKDYQRVSKTIHTARDGPSESRQAVSSYEARPRFGIENEAPRAGHGQREGVDQGVWVSFFAGPKISSVAFFAAGK
jgi:hypothetical protein